MNEKIIFLHNFSSLKIEIYADEVHLLSLETKSESKGHETDSSFAKSDPF